LIEMLEYLCMSLYIYHLYIDVYISEFSMEEGERGGFMTEILTF
jgi:hypothetical protein